MPSSFVKATCKHVSSSFKKPVGVWIVAFYLHMACSTRVLSDDEIDFKFMYYQEDDDRIRVLTPAALLETELSPTLSIKLEAVYNVISGASPTGEPLSSSPITLPLQTAPTISSGLFLGATGASGRAAPAPTPQPRPQPAPVARPAPQPAPVMRTPTPQPAPQPAVRATPAPQPAPPPTAPPPQQAAPAAPNDQVKTAQLEDERFAISLELAKRLNDHVFTFQGAYSSESDYESIAGSLKHAIDISLHNRTWRWGLAFTHDTISAFTQTQEEDRDTIDFIVGVTQILSPKTLFEANMQFGYGTGYFTDPYKVVELNGTLVPERRPDEKHTQVLYLSLLHYIKWLRASAELSYRWYNDSFGIQGNTATLTWHQHIGDRVVLSPLLRYYRQSEADFYGLRFAGSPSEYSSDYRVSAFEALSYGIKLAVTTEHDVTYDLAYERYEQEGTDGVTPASAYPSAHIVTIGLRKTF